MIYTVTFNPAIDYVVHIPELQKGNILRASDENAFFGGKGINVSLILKELGIPSTATGFVAGFTGKALEDGIRCEEITSDFVTLKNGLTRINVKIRANEETDINGNGPEITNDDIEELYKKLDKLNEGDTLILAGSIPSTLPSDIYERIMERLQSKSINFVVDAEKDLLLNSLKYNPFLIKPNNDELGKIFGVEINTPDEIIPYAEKLQKMGAKNVLVSMGHKGSVLLDENGESHFKEVYKIKAVNSVGAGDSMVAGFVAGYQKTHDYKYALTLGTASGGATASSEGLATKEKILNLINQK